MLRAASRNSILSFLAAVATLVSAQSAPQADPASAESAKPTVQLHVSVPLVLEDVIVVDADDQPVHGLTASDFKITEDGVPVTLRNFAEVTAPSTPAPPARPIHLGLNTFTNMQDVEPGASLNILLLDVLNTPSEDQERVREQMLSYLKELTPNTRIAIFGLGSHLFFLQGFTSDPAVLRAAIEGRHSTALSPLLDDPVSGAPGLAIEDMMDSGSLLPSEVVANIDQFEAEQETAETRSRMVYTLEAMNQLAHYLAALPGRKNLIWFSGSFPLNILPDENLPDPFAAADDFSDDVRQTAELFARSRVAVYPVGARGVLVNPAYTTSQSLPRMGRSGMNPANAQTAIAAANRSFLRQTVADESTMDLIAAETGGKAFYNTNGLKQALEKAIDYGENYYALAYTPTNMKADGAYRKIAIKAVQPGLHLYYRPGYFSDDGSGSQADRQKVLPRDAFRTAMLQGGPDATEVAFAVKLIPAEKPTDQLSAGEQTDPKRMKPPYMSYVARFIVNLETTRMSIDAQGGRHGAAALVVVVYDRDGQPVSSTSKQVKVDIPADKVIEALQTGASAQLRFDVPMKGEYFVRAGVEDLVGSRVGSLEAPVAALKTFQQLQAEAAKTVPSAAK